MEATKKEKKYRVYTKMFMQTILTRYPGRWAETPLADNAYLEEIYNTDHHLDGV